MTKESKREFSFRRGWGAGRAAGFPAGGRLAVGAALGRGPAGRAPDLVDGGEAVADLVDLFLGVGAVRVVGDLPDARRRRDRVGAVPGGLPAGRGEISG